MVTVQWPGIELRPGCPATAKPLSVNAHSTDGPLVSAVVPWAAPVPVAAMVTARAWLTEPDDATWWPSKNAATTTSTTPAAVAAGTKARFTRVPFDAGRAGRTLLSNLGGLGDGLNLGGAPHCPGREPGTPADRRDIALRPARQAGNTASAPSGEHSQRSARRHQTSGHQAQHHQPDLISARGRRRKNRSGRV